MPPLAQRAAAELLGTYLLVLVAAGVVVVDTLFDGSVTPVGVAAGAGIIVMLMVYVLGPVSGAHINPAVTLGMALSGRAAWRDVPAYWAAQLLGAAAAGGTLRLMFGLVENLGGHEPSGAAAQSLAAEVLATFMLMFVIASVVSNPKLAPLSGVAIGSMVAVGILLFGPVSGGSMNPPARSARRWPPCHGPATGYTGPVPHWALRRQSWCTGTWSPGGPAAREPHPNLSPRGEGTSRLT